MVGRHPILFYAALTGATIAAPASAEAGAHHFVTVDAIEAPIIISNRVDGVLRVKLVLDIADAADVAEIEARLPEIRAASVAATAEFSRLYASSFAPVDAARLSASITAALKRAEPRIARVLIVEVGARPA